MEREREREIPREGPIARARAIVTVVVGGNLVIRKTETERGREMT